MDKVELFEAWRTGTASELFPPSVTRASDDTVVYERVLGKHRRLTGVKVRRTLKKVTQRGQGFNGNA